MCWVFLPSATNWRPNRDKSEQDLDTAGSDPRPRLDGIKEKPVLQRSPGGEKDKNPRTRAGKVKRTWSPPHPGVDPAGRASPRSAARKVKGSPRTRDEPI